MNPAISVIVPVYNVEAYVRKSLQSVAKQTFDDWECIVVDDGSTDGSGAICDEFAARDPRFRVIHQENRGLSGARNTGLAVAQGRYIGFLDSDDYIHPDMYQVLFTAIEQTGADFAVVNTRVVNNMDEPFQPNPPIKYWVMNREQLFTYWFENKENGIMMSVAWNKLYNRHIIHEIFFNDVLSEDCDYNVRVLRRCVQAVIINQVLHHYHQRPDSIISRRSYSDVVNARLSFFLALYNYGDDSNAMTATELANYHIRMMKMYLSLRFQSRRFPHISQKVHQCMTKVKHDFLSDSLIPIKLKMIMGLMFYCPWVYAAFINYCEFRARLSF